MEFQAVIKSDSSYNITKIEDEIIFYNILKNKGYYESIYLYSNFINLKKGVYVSNIDSLNIVKSFNIIKDYLKALTINCEEIGYAMAEDSLETENKVRDEFMLYKDFWVLNFDKEFKDNSHKLTILPNVKYLNELNN